MHVKPQGCLQFQAHTPMHALPTDLGEGHSLSDYRQAIADITERITAAEQAAVALCRAAAAAAGAEPGATGVAASAAGAGAAEAAAMAAGRAVTWRGLLTTTGAWWGGGIP